MPSCGVCASVRLSVCLSRSWTLLKRINVYVIFAPFSFHRATRMHSITRTMPWQDVCLSVRLSVYHTPVLSLNGYTYLQRFSPSGSPAILFFLYQTGWQYSDGDPLTGASNVRVMKKSRFSTNMSLYLANDARQSHSYYGRQIGNRTQAFEWYQFE